VVRQRGRDQEKMVEEKDLQMNFSIRGARKARTGMISTGGGAKASRQTAGGGGSERH